MILVVHAIKSSIKEKRENRIWVKALRVEFMRTPFWSYNCYFWWMKRIIFLKDFLFMFSFLNDSVRMFKSKVLTFSTLYVQEWFYLGSMYHIFDNSDWRRSHHDHTIEFKNLILNFWYGSFFEKLVMCFWPQILLWSLFFLVLFSIRSLAQTSFWPHVRKER